MVRNYFSASISSGASSNLDLATTHLGQYRKIVEEVKSRALEMELALYDLPPGHPHLSNERYGWERMGRDVVNEETHLSRLEEVVAGHGELQNCLEDFNEQQFDLEHPAIDQALGLLEGGPERQLHSFFQFTVPADVLHQRLLGAQGGGNPTGQGQQEQEKPADASLKLPVVPEDKTTPVDPGQDKTTAQKQDSAKAGGTAGERPRTQGDDRLFLLKVSIQTRKDLVATTLIGIEEALRMQPATSSEAVRCVEDMLLDIAKEI